MMKEDEEYWLEQFDDQVPILELPTDYSRPTSRTFAGNSIGLRLEEEITHNLINISRKTDSTIYMVILSALNILLAKYSGQEDIVIGSPIAGRSHPELERIVGIFVNTLAMRNYPERDKSYREFLLDVRQTALEAYQHQDYQFERLVDQLELRRDLSRNPLFDVMLSMHNPDREQLEIEGLKISPYRHDKKLSKFDLTFWAQEGEEEINFEIEYSTELFKEETIKRLASHLKNIFAQIAVDPLVKIEKIGLLTRAEREDILYGWNQTSREYPREKTVYQLFEEQVKLKPDQIAISGSEQELTYRQLNNGANQIAQLIRRKGIGPDELVGLMVENSIEAMVAILAVLKAGGGYLPIDAGYPEERCQFMLDDSNCRLLLTQTTLKGKADIFDGEVLEVDNQIEDYNQSVANLKPTSTKDNLAYVIYTSGSTGQPKGVMIEHQGLTNYIWWAKDYYCNGEGGHFPLYSSLSFDLTMTSIFVPLITGGQIRVIRGEGANLINQVINDEGVETVKLTPAHLSLIKAGEKGQSDIKQMILGGEELKSELARETVDNFDDLIIYNEYGPTETVVGCTVHKFEPEEEYSSVPIGRPIQNTQIYILDQARQPLPPGAVGEIYISGDGVARGYLNRPELTTDRFVENPFIPGQRMYKTGDLGKYLENGEIQYLGRIDNQVKVNGFRIEMGEIEAGLLTHPQISDGVVDTRLDHNQDRYLVAYYISREDLAVGQLREHLSRLLPDYMIPTRYVRVDEIPLTANGKVNREKLPDPKGEVVVATSYQPPRNSKENMLVELWQEILGVNRVGINDNFFELGGHSLKATSFVSRLERELDITLPLSQVFKSPTIKELAERIAVTEEEVYFSIKPIPESDYYPVSSAQKRIYLQCQYEEGGISYNMPGAVWIEGELDLDIFESVFYQLIERHETLRTAFEIVEGQIVQRIVDSVEFKIDYLEKDGEEIEEIVRDFIRPFDLTQPPLLRVGVVKVEQQRYLMIFDIHHIVSDGLSQKILIDEFTRLYQGDDLEELKIQYKDFSVWQKEFFKSEIMDAEKQYWLDTLSGGIPVLNLPYDYPRPPIQSYSGERIRFEIQGQLDQRLRELAAEKGVSMYMVLLTAYYLLFYKYTGQEDIIIGSTIAGRRHADLEKIIGMFVNMLALRNNPVADKTLLDFLEEVKENTLEAFDNQDYQFERLIEDLELKRQMSRNPLFDVVFSMQHSDEKTLAMEELAIRSYRLENGVSKFDISLDVVQQQERLSFILEYCTELFKRETMERLKVHYLNILQEMVDRPDVKLGDMEIISPAEREKLLYQFNDTAVKYNSGMTLDQLVEEQVEKRPGTVAIVYHGEELSYGQLNRRANSLARVLRTGGVGPDEIVGIMAERSSSMLIAILAILKAGGAYLPIDPGYPTGRQEYMLADSGTKILLTNDINPTHLEYSGTVINLADESLYTGNGDNLIKVTCPTDLAYVMYTSGSTGEPKGVMIEHKSVVNLSYYYNKLLELGGKNIVHLSNVSFDTSVVEIFPPLLFGATIYVIDKEIALDQKRFIQFVDDCQINIAQFVPMMLRELLLDTEKPESLQWIIVGGDKLGDSLKDQILSLGYQVTNHYGPTECTVDATVAKCQVGETTIGRPIANTRIYILDEGDNLVPIGVPGELCIAGQGLARGYINKEELTLEKFVDNPFQAGEKMYRTGDRACWQPDGTINFLGRMDHQVKIRGYRIETGEIEALLLENKKIDQVVVVDKTDTQGIKYLAAYYTLADQPGSDQIEPAKLRRYMTRELPDYMIPTYFSQLEEMPYTHNGKIDRQALLEIADQLDSGVTYAGPTNSIERKLIEIWQEVLDVEGIGIDQDFFELGGHSLKATTIVSRIYSQLDLKVSLSTILKYTTIRELADQLQQMEREGYKPIPAVEEKEYYQLSSAQGRIYIQWQLNGESTAYNMPTALLMEGNIELAQLERAINDLIDRHQVFRTSFEMVNGQPVQQIHNKIEIEIDYQKLGSGEEITEILEEFIRPFDLAVPPLLRVGLIRLDNERHLLLFDMHHIISDGISTSIMVRDFADLYQGKSLEPLRVQYKDYAVWHNQLLKSKEMARLGQYWVNRLKDLEYTQLPVRNVVQDGDDGKKIKLELNPSMTADITEFCRKNKLTKSAFILSIFKLILMKTINQQDLTIGLTSAGRRHQDLDDILGVFLNVMAIRTRIEKESTFTEYLDKVVDNLLEAQEYQDYPYEELYTRLKEEFNYQHQSLFSILYNYQTHQSGQAIKLDGLNIKPYQTEEVNPKFDLVLHVNEMEEMILITGAYKVKLGNKVIERIINSFPTVIKRVLDNQMIKVKELNLINSELAQDDFFAQELEEEFDDLDLI